MTDFQDLEAEGDGRWGLQELQAKVEKEMSSVLHGDKAIQNRRMHICINFIVFLWCSLRYIYVHLIFVIMMSSSIFENLFIWRHIVNANSDGITFGRMWD